MQTPHRERLRKLIDQSLSESFFAWWEWDVQSNLVTASPLKVGMLGYDADTFASAGYEAYMSLVHPEDYERTMQAMRDHLESRAPIYQIDYRIRKPDGSYTWYMDRGLIIQRGNDGAPLRLRGIVIDLGSSIECLAEDDERVACIRAALPTSADSAGTISLCSSCKRLKLAEDDWMEVDESLPQAFPQAVSHGICPDCIARLYPELRKSSAGNDG